MNVPCTHWSPCGVHGGGCCGLGLYGGRPSIGSCALCPSRVPTKNGIGDTVANIALVTGLASLVNKVTGGDCGCSAMQKDLNEFSRQVNP